MSRSQRRQSWLGAGLIPTARWHLPVARCHCGTRPERAARDRCGQPFCADYLQHVRQWRLCHGCVGQIDREWRSPSCGQRWQRQWPTLLVGFCMAATVALGRVPPNATAESLRLLAGISVYRTEAQARRKARQYRVLGAFLAELHLPAGLAARIERTTPSAGHHTIWAPAESLLTCVVRVVSVSRPS